MTKDDEHSVSFGEAERSLQADVVMLIRYRAVGGPEQLTATPALIYVP